MSNLYIQKAGIDIVSENRNLTPCPYQQANRILNKTHIHRHPRTCCGDPCLNPIALKILPGFSEKFEEWIPVTSTGMTKGRVIAPYAIRLPYQGEGRGGGLLQISAKNHETINTLSTAPHLNPPPGRGGNFNRTGVCLSQDGRRGHGIKRPGVILVR